MANLLLTQKCVRSCPYCFAKEHMSISEAQEVLSWEDLIYLVDLFSIAGHPQISLLGGEPTLHPYFIDMVLYLVERKFHVTVFTSGIMSETNLEAAKRAFASLTAANFNFVCNINHPSLSTGAENQRIEAFLHAFGPLVSPGFNIYEPEFNLDFLFEYVSKFGLNRSLRLGLAQPIPGMKNSHVALADLPKVANRLCEYLPMMERLRIRPGFDCGFLLCMFTDEQLGKLFKLNLGNLKFGCGPAIDIGPDMSVWSCFPLSTYHKKSAYDFDSVHEITDFYNKIHQSLRVESGGVFEKCDDCLHRYEGLCAGGCLSHLVNHIRQEEMVRIAEVYG